MWNLDSTIYYKGAESILAENRSDRVQRLIKVQASTSGPFRLLFAISLGKHSILIKNKRNRQSGAAS